MSNKHQPTLEELLSRGHLTIGEVATAFVLANEQGVKLEHVRIDLTTRGEEVKNRNFDPKEVRNAK